MDMQNPAPPPVPDRIRNHPGFLAVWAGQSVSAIGMQMTMFALSIWVFQQTGSVTDFGLVVAAQLLPGILLSSPAGVLVDRHDRRRVMMASKVGAAAIAAVAYALLMQGLLTPLTAGLIAAATGVFGMLHQIAYSAALPMMLPKPLLRRANSLVQTSLNLSAVLVPLTAVGMLELVGLGAILILEGVCFLLAGLSLLFARFAPVPAHTRQKPASMLTAGFSYIRGRPDLVVLFVFLTAAGFLNGFVYVIFRPLVLTLADTAALGVIVTFAGVGGLLGALSVGLLARGGGDRISPIIWFSLLSGASMILCGVTTSLYVIGAAAFLFSLSLPVVVVTVQTLLQTSVPTDVQGRVFAARTLLGNLAMLFAVVTSPLLADHVAEPLMAEGGMLAGLIGNTFGTGPGRGMALLFVVAGLLMMLVVASVGRSAALRALWRDPDAQLPGGAMQVAVPVPAAAALSPSEK